MIHVKWTNDNILNHTSTFDSDVVESLTSSSTTNPDHFSQNTDPARIPWTRTQLAENLSNLTFSYQDYLYNSSELPGILERLLSWGIIFITQVPSSSASIESLATRLGPVRNTFYGPTWDVRSTPTASNIANTSTELDFHQDLLYMAHPPDFQLLHMLTPSRRGGESLFVDGLNAIQELQPTLQPALRNYPVTYQYRNAGQWYRYTRPTLQVTSKGHFEAVNYSPPFQTHARIGFPVTTGKGGISGLRDYHAAIKAFDGIIHDPGNVYETMLPRGTAVCFDNRRVLHARRAFSDNVADGTDLVQTTTGLAEEDDGGRTRWLRGAYVDRDPVQSLWRTLRLLS